MRRRSVKFPVKQSAVSLVTVRANVIPLFHERASEQKTNFLSKFGIQPKGQETFQL